MLLKVAPDTTKVKDNDGKTPLHLASWEGHTEIVLQLLEVASETAKEKDDYGWTPLHWASRWGYTEVVSLLLEVAPDIVNVKNNDKKAPLYKATVDNELKTIQILFTSISIKLETEILKINKKTLEKKYIF